MFSMPQGNASIHATTDGDPLMLYDDVDDFRALCWIIYALPEVCLQQNEIATADMQKFVSLYLIAHKYHFESHETHSRNLLYKHLASHFNSAQPSPAVPPNYFQKCGQSQLQSLLRIVSLEKEASTKDSFLDLLQKLWITRLRKSPESTSFAFEVAEELGLRMILANLYVMQLGQMDTDSERIEGSTTYIQKADLAPHRKLALFHGYWSLRRYWSETKLTAPGREFPYSSSSEQHVCQTIWKKAWTTKIAADHQDPSTPTVKLMGVEKEIRGSAKQYKVVVPCAGQAIRSTMMSELRSSFADHLLGPRPNVNK